MKKSIRILFVFLFCILICSNYLTLWNHLTTEFIDALYDSYRDLSTFQTWIFDVIGLLNDAVITALVVGIFAYSYKKYKTRANLARFMAQLSLVSALFRESGHFGP